MLALPQTLLGAAFRASNAKPPAASLAIFSGLSPHFAGLFSLIQQSPLSHGFASTVSVTRTSSFRRIFRRSKSTVAYQLYITVPPSFTSLHLTGILSSHIFTRRVSTVVRNSERETTLTSVLLQSIRIVLLATIASLLLCLHCKLNFTIVVYI